MRVVNLAAMFGRFDEAWSPRVVGELNGQEVKLARLRGEFVWHQHADADELFLVIEGRLRMRLRTGDLELGAGEFLIVPRGVEHCPVADAECRVLLFEPAGTRNTGEVEDARTVESPERL
ncbi:MAG: cupin domain-containing protein [Caldilineae bacterium]|nr:cupin domain-containing protein [Caldilineae bacterium]